MKKVLVALICLLMMGGIMAQEHLKFKGVPIDGTLKQYTEAMKKAGFEYQLTQDGISLLRGDFAGYKGCMVGVSTLKNCDVVNRIIVLFPERDTWTSLIGDYEHFKSLLTTKYGEPDSNLEEFTTYTGDNNGLKMSALHDDEVVWYTAWSEDLGDIELTIVGSSYGNGCVRLSYFDKANSETVKQAALEDL